uniref:Uncharacterized protein n=1 Tax=Glossina pallidipes TaxID=7398 RepID=A0A1B0AAA3_GLOPL
MALTQQDVCNNCLKVAANAKRVARNNARTRSQCWTQPRETNLCGLEKLQTLKEQESLFSPQPCAHAADKCAKGRYVEKLSKLKSETGKSNDCNSLGNPIGLVKSKINFKTDSEAHDVAPARFATYLVAFARFHLNPETTWNSEIIEEVLQNGLMLYAASQKSDNQLVSSHEIYAPHELNILREFVLLGCKFQIELVKISSIPSIRSIPSRCTEKPNQTGVCQVADMLCLKNVKAVLGNILRERTFYLLKVNQLYIMIWINCGVFFIFDVCGRDVTDFHSVEKDGVAVLLTLKSLRNVLHLITHLSGLNKEDLCTIRELKIAKVITASGYTTQRDYSEQRPEYNIINDDTAYVAATLHLSLNPAELLRNRSALPACVTALVVSKINHPATWNTKTVDNIICYGVNFFQTYWLNYANSDPIDVNELPAQFNIGQFQAEIELFPKRYVGSWRWVPSYKFTDLTLNVEKGFVGGDTKLLLQINYQMYTIWKQNEFIYLFDPFRHRIPAVSNEQDSIESVEKYATVRMFRSFDVFIKELNSILMDSNKCSPFSLHVVKIRRIGVKAKPYDDSPALFEKSLLDPNGEVLSLNEVICFEDTNEACEKLREISDFEDEELHSNLEELELRSTSSELEILEEEMEDIEEDDVNKYKKKVNVTKKKHNVTKKKTKRLLSRSGAKRFPDSTRRLTDVKLASIQSNPKEKRSLGLENGKNTKESNQSSDESAQHFENNKSIHSTPNAENFADFPKMLSEGHLAIARSVPIEGKSIELEESLQVYRDTREKEGKEFLFLQQLEDEKLRDTRQSDEASAEHDVFSKGAKHLRSPLDTYKHDDFIKRVTDVESTMTEVSPRNESLLETERQRLFQSEQPIKRDESKHKLAGAGISYLQRWECKRIKKALRRNETIDECEDFYTGTKHYTSPVDVIRRWDHTRGSADMDLKVMRLKPKKESLLENGKKKSLSFEESVRNELDANENCDDEKDVSRFQRWEVERLKKTIGADKADYLSEEFCKQTQHSHPSSKADCYPFFRSKQTGMESEKMQSDHKEESCSLSESKRLLGIEQTKQKGLNPNNNMKGGGKASWLERWELERLGNIIRSEKAAYESQVFAIEKARQVDLYGYKKRTKEDEEFTCFQRRETPKAYKGYDKGEEEVFKYTIHLCSAPNANSYPGYTSKPMEMAVIGSQSGSYNSLFKLICSGFKTADRILLMTRWKNFILFRCNANQTENYFLYDGCIRDVNHFRHLDLTMGTYGFLCFREISDVIAYIVREQPSQRLRYLT